MIKMEETKKGFWNKKTVSVLFGLVFMIFGILRYNSVLAQQIADFVVGFVFLYVLLSLMGAILSLKNKRLKKTNPEPIE